MRKRHLAKILEKNQSNEVMPSYCIVLGAGLYWGTSTMRSTSNFSPSQSLGFTLSIDSKATIFVSTLIICFLFLLCSTKIRSIDTGRNLPWVAVFTGFLSFIISAITLIFPDSVLLTHMLYNEAKALAVSFNATILMVLWGYIFCSMNTRCAGVTVIFTALLSLAVYLIEAVVQSLGIRTLLMDFALIASSLLLLRASSSVERKTTKSIRSGHPLASLVGSRVLIGLGSGIVVALSGMYRDGSEPNFISSFICLALLVGAVCFLRKKIPGYQIIFLPIIPLLICGIAIAPFVGVSVVHLVLASPAIIWLSWMVLSSVQLSGLRNSVAVSGIALVAIDRISFIMFRFAGGSLLQIQSDSLVARTGSFYISFAIVFAVVTFVTVVLLLLASNHEEQKIIQKMTESADEDFAYIYDSIAEEYSLTSKEREVLAMLAEGHTRPYIADKLFVSDSTARTHARNIYKKLGCHKKEELLDLVLAKKKPLS